MLQPSAVYKHWKTKAFWSKTNDSIKKITKQNAALKRAEFLLNTFRLFDFIQISERYKNGEERRLWIVSHKTDLCSSRHHGDELHHWHVCFINKWADSCIDHWSMNGTTKMKREIGNMHRSLYPIKTYGLWFKLTHWFPINPAQSLRH